MTATTTNVPPTIARLMLPDDANLAGNVHGGTILQLMEQAGMISTARHFNKNSTDPAYKGKQYAGLARIETMSFHQPVFVGEIASVSAELVFSSERSVLAEVVVTAENAMTGKVRKTNTGLLWYLPMVPQAEDMKRQQQRDPLIVSVPPIPPPPADDEGKTKLYQASKGMYEARKAKEQATTNGTNNNNSNCLQIKECYCPNCRETYTPPENSISPSSSRQVLSQMVLPGDCGTSHVAFGGFVMKLMDTAAGCCAFRHARSNVVTVSISAMDFVSMVYLGDIVTIEAEMRFCSSKSMEIGVTASVSSMTRQDVVVALGYFSFVALDENNKVKEVAPLKLESEDEFERAWESQRRYVEGKRARAKAI